VKPSLWKSPPFATLVIVGLVAGTALVAGYVDKPDQAAQMAAEDKCDGCPRLNMEACCKVTGVCAEPQTCTGSCIEETSEAQPAGCCPSTAQAVCPVAAGEAQATCPMRAGQEGQVEGSCGAAGCTRAE
jgi:hypothetical protein